MHRVMSGSELHSLDPSEIQTQSQSPPRSSRVRARSAFSLTLLASSPSLRGGMETPSILIETLESDTEPGAPSKFAYELNQVGRERTSIVNMSWTSKMWSSGWGWQLAASAAAFTVCTAASVAFIPPLHRRYKHSQVAKRIPLSSYLAFDLSVRFRAYLHSKGGVSSELTKLPDVEALAPGVIRILGKNPGRMTLQGTNTYLLGHGPQRFLLDSSDGNLAYIENLMRVCTAHGVEEITDLIITHGHSDHIGGVLHLREAFPHIRVWKYMPSGGADRTLRYTNAECETLLIQPLTSTKCFDVPGMDAVLRTEYMPGHCADHSCFLLDDQATGKLSLFSGDCILGEGSCVFESLKDLMHSLVRLRALAPSIIYPAHGPVVEDAGTKIEEYISHRMQREQEVIQVLKAASSRMSAKQVVTTIYKDLPFVLQLAARKAIQKHLEKLIHDKRVREIATSSWFSSPTYELIAA